MPESRKYSERAKYPDNFSFCAFRINHAGDLIFANDNFVRLLGFSSFAELQNYSDMHESLEKCFSPQRFYSYLKNNNKGINQFTWVTKNESKILLKEYAYPVFQYESIAYFDCIVEDVSEKNLVSKILNDINSNDGSILKAIPDFIFVVSHDGTII
ncbi:MAG: PAS domain-containing protein [Bacteroidota bacterium]